MSYRNRKLLDLCHQLTDCLLQLPGCYGYSAEGLEPCHSNWQEEGIGMSHKADDSAIAAGCHHCHMELDDRANITREEKIWYWQRGVIRTQREFWKRGWVKLA